MHVHQFKLELLTGLVIYEADGIVRIGFGHYSLLTQRSAFAKLRQTGAIYHIALRQSKTKSLWRDGADSAPSPRRSELRSYTNLSGLLLFSAAVLAE